MLEFCLIFIIGSIAGGAAKAWLDWRERMEEREAREIFKH